jgi:hypothetical protein
MAKQRIATAISTHAVREIARPRARRPGRVGPAEAAADATGEVEDAGVDVVMMAA